MSDQHWREYERVATYLLSKLASEFGLRRVEGKQRLVGGATGTEWEVDAKVKLGHPQFRPPPRAPANWRQ